jgi:hypothetical protein
VVASGADLEFDTVSIVVTTLSIDLVVHHAQTSGTVRRGNL